MLREYFLYNAFSSRNVYHFSKFTLLHFIHINSSSLPDALFQWTSGLFWWSISALRTLFQYNFCHLFARARGSLEFPHYYLNKANKHITATYLLLKSQIISIFSFLTISFCSFFNISMCNPNALNSLIPVDNNSNIYCAKSFFNIN